MLVRLLKSLLDLSSVRKKPGLEHIFYSETEEQLYSFMVRKVGSLLLDQLKLDS